MHELMARAFATYLVGLYEWIVVTATFDGQSSHNTLEEWSQAAVVQDVLEMMVFAGSHILINNHNHC